MRHVHAAFRAAHIRMVLDPRIFYSARKCSYRSPPLTVAARYLAPPRRALGHFRRTVVRRAGGTRRPQATRRRSASRYFSAVFAMDLGRQGGGRRGLVPVEGVEVVADELLVEARRAHPRRVLVGRPEAGGVRGQHLVDEDEPAVFVHRELELGVRDDDPARAGVLRREAVEVEGDIADSPGDVGADETARGVEVDVLVVLARFRLGRGGEERLGQAFGLAQTLGQPDPRTPSPSPGTRATRSR